MKYFKIDPGKAPTLKKMSFVFFVIYKALVVFSCNFDIIIGHLPTPGFVATINHYTLLDGTNISISTNSLQNNKIGFLFF